MTIDYKDYPPDWKTVIRPRILARANNKCERCGVPNRATICRSRKDPARYIIWDSKEGGFRQPDGTMIRLSEIPEEFDISLADTLVVLTVAHLDQDIKNNDDANLMALCQRCHLLHDSASNARKRRHTLREKKHPGQLTYLED